MNLNKQKIRAIFRWIITIGSYIFTITFLFHNHEFLLSLSSVFVFFIVYHFFYIEIYKFNWKYILLALIIWTIITGIISNPQTTTMRIANIGFHSMIWILTYTLYQETEGSIWFSWLSYFSAGWYLFTMALALVYSTVIVNFFSKFPMNCEELNQKSNNIISIITKPFKISWEKTQEITESTKNFLFSSFSDLSAWAENIKITSANNENKVVQKITLRKEKLITNTLKENQKLNNTICDFTLKTINEKLKSPTIQYPVIILILFLIYPFLRIIVWIISLIGFLLFEITYLLQIYVKRKEKKEVERIG